jgi:hypothetical protein
MNSLTFCQTIFKPADLLRFQTDARTVYHDKKYIRVPCASAQDSSSHNYRNGTVQGDGMGYCGGGFGKAA